MRRLAQARGTRMPDIAQDALRQAEAIADLCRAALRLTKSAHSRLIGMVSLGDIAAKGADGEVAGANSLGDISSPAEPDRTSP